MRKYRSNAASETRTAYGAVLVEGLRSFDETRGLAEEFEPLNERLELAIDARREKERLARQAMARLRVREFLADRAVIALVRAIEARGAPIDLFPEGRRALTSASGRAKLNALHEIVVRVLRCEALADWEPRLRTELRRLGERVAEHELARREQEATLRLEGRVRDEHARAIARIADRVDAAFPDDRGLQKVVFPGADRRSVGGTW